MGICRRCQRTFICTQYNVSLVCYDCNRGGCAVSKVSMMFKIYLRIRMIMLQKKQVRGRGFNLTPSVGSDVSYRER